MIHVRQVIIVEGRYDKNAVLQCVDATVIETGGFQIFNDAEKRALIRKLAGQRGLVVLTDSDSAGFVIRNFLRGCVPTEQILHAYIPQIPGKERRKTHPSAEGSLGVEGMKPEVIIDALRRAGADLGEGETVRSGKVVTKADFYADGLSGGAGSNELRLKLASMYGLPDHMTANALLEAINILGSYDEYKASVEKCRIK